MNQIKLNCLVTINYIIYQEKVRFNYWNQSNNGNVIHKDDVKFPNFSQNSTNFPNSMGPSPIPKNTIFTLIVIKLVLISVPTMYLSYSYNLIATHKILRTPYLGAPLLGG